jgi:hypothetical protein
VLFDLHPAQQRILVEAMAAIEEILLTLAMRGPYIPDRYERASSPGLGRPATRQATRQ